MPAQPGSRASIKPRASCVRSVTASQGFEQSSWRLTCGDLVARVPPRERERERAGKEVIDLYCAANFGTEETEVTGQKRRSDGQETGQKRRRQTGGAARERMEQQIGSAS